MRTIEIKRENWVYRIQHWDTWRLLIDSISRYFSYFPDRINFWRFEKPNTICISPEDDVIINWVSLKNRRNKMNKYYSEYRNKATLALSLQLQCVFM